MPNRGTDRPLDPHDGDALTQREYRDSLGISEERFTEALENVRREVNQGLTTAGVQIGAVEATLKAEVNTVRSQIASAKVWGALALVSGQTVAAIVAAYTHPVLQANSMHAVRTVASWLAL